MTGERPNGQPGESAELLQPGTAGVRDWQGVHLAAQMVQEGGEIGRVGAEWRGRGHGGSFAAAPLILWID